MKPVVFTSHASLCSSPLLLLLLLSLRAIDAETRARGGAVGDRSTPKGFDPQTSNLPPFDVEQVASSSDFMQVRVHCLLMAVVVVAVVVVVVAAAAAAAVVVVVVVVVMMMMVVVWWWCCCCAWRGAGTHFAYHDACVLQPSPAFLPAGPLVAWQQRRRHERGGRRSDDRRVRLPSQARSPAEGPQEEAPASLVHGAGCAQLRRAEYSQQPQRPQQLRRQQCGPGV
jgi:hypothetical protein